ncbi:MAG: hypothetical protein ACREKN_01800 [Longimicrobiaceae bacterium]
MEPAKHTSPACQALERVALELPPSGVESVWLFPARRRGRTESRLLVLSGLVEGEPGRRRLLTYQYDFDASRPEPETEGQLQEEGTAPVARVPGLLRGVVERLEKESGDAPEEWWVGGEPERWQELLSRLEESAGS